MRILDQLRILGSLESLLVLHITKEVIGDVYLLSAEEMSVGLGLEVSSE